MVSAHPSTLALFIPDSLLPPESLSPYLAPTSPDGLTPHPPARATAHVTVTDVDETVSKSGKQTSCNFCGKALAGAFQANRWLPHWACTKAASRCKKVPANTMTWAKESMATAKAGGTHPGNGRVGWCVFVRKQNVRYFYVFYSAACVGSCLASFRLASFRFHSHAAQIRPET